MSSDQQDYYEEFEFGAKIFTFWLQIFFVCNAVAGAILGLIAIANFELTGTADFAIALLVVLNAVGSYLTYMVAMITINWMRAAIRCLNRTMNSTQSILNMTISHTERSH